MGSEARDEAGTGSGPKGAWALLAAAAALAAGAIGYRVMSGPETPEPVAVQTDALPDLTELIEAAEANPQDAAKWGALAAARFERGEYAEAAAAYKKVVAIAPEKAAMWSALGEAITYSTDASARNADPLPAEALEAFQKANALDPEDPVSRYFLAVRKDLDGNHEAAITDWLALLEDTPTGAPWEPNLIQTIQQVAQINSINVEERLAKVMQGRLPPIAVPGSGAVAGAGASGSVGGPTQEQIAAAQSLSAEEQQAQIEGMVAMAEAKLKDDPSNLDRWVMVMRSHSMLGNAAKAKATLEAAVAANPANEAELRRQAQALGVQ